MGLISISSLVIKPMLAFLLLLSLLAVGSCNSKMESKPTQLSDWDVLLQANGYWEWEGSTTLGKTLTPTSVGFGRELIFKCDGLVHIYHNQQPALQPTYQLSAGVLSRCGIQPQPIAVPLVRYTAESQIPNNDLRTYLIRLSPTDTTLSITGELACVDGGYYETYRWRRH